MDKKAFLKNVKDNRKCQVNIWYMVASWAFEVIVILTQKRLLCVTKDFYDLTSPTSNHIPDVNLVISVK